MTAQWIAPAVISLSPDKSGADAVAREGLPFAEFIEDAGKAARSLRQLTVQGRQGAAKAGKASIELQERLRLGARMLKAFAVQIRKIESGLSEMRQREERLQSLVAALEQSAAELQSDQDSALAGFKQKLARAAEEAQRQFDQELVWRLRERETSASLFEELADEVRRRVNRDMGWLSSAMRDMAGNIERLTARVPPQGPHPSVPNAEAISAPAALSAPLRLHACAE